MTKVIDVEKRIHNLEGFDIHILHLSGRDVRGNRMGLPQYPYQAAATDDMTVGKWKVLRFRNAYPGFEAAVLGPEGHTCTWQYETRHG